LVSPSLTTTRNFDRHEEKSFYDLAPHYFSSGHRLAYSRADLYRSYKARTASERAGADRSDSNDLQGTREIIPCVCGPANLLSISAASERFTKTLGLECRAMARARSVEKQAAILQSATREIANHGMKASTAKIAQGAGLAEGTIFTYFASKELLFNELYITLKLEVYERINQGFPHGAALRARACHIWTQYLRWAIEKPQNHKASVLLNLSALISEDTRANLEVIRGPVKQTMGEVDRIGVFRELPKGFAASAMIALQSPVIELVTQHPRRSRGLIQGAFDAFWKMAE